MHPLAALRPVLTLDEVDALRAAARTSTSTRAPPLDRRASCARRATLDGVDVGASVRGSLALERAARAWALLDGRDYVTPVDVERLFLPVVVHRIVFTPGFVAEARELGWQAAVGALRERVPRARAAPGRRPRRAGRRRSAGRAERRDDLPAHAAAAGARPPVRRDAQRCAAGSARTSPARGRTGRATTSTRSTGTRRRGSRSRAGTDEFVVREHFAEEAPRVVVLCDRRPSMSLFPPGWPWLRKPRAIEAAIRLIGDSALAARGLLGYLDHGGRRAVLAAAARPARRCASSTRDAALRRAGGHARARPRAARRATAATCPPARSSSSSPTSSRRRRGTPGCGCSSGAGTSSRSSSRTRSGSRASRTSAASSCRSPTRGRANVALARIPAARVRRAPRGERAAPPRARPRACARSTWSPSLVSSHDRKRRRLRLPDLGRPAALHAGTGVRLFVVSLAALALLASGCAGGEEAADLPLGRQVTAQSSLAPTVHLFAEPVLARVDVVVDRDHLDPDRVRLQTKFLPYDVAATTTDRIDRGRFTELRYRRLLRCLRSRASRRSSRAPPARPRPGAASGARSTSRPHRCSTTTRRERRGR